MDILLKRIIQVQLWLNVANALSSCREAVPSACGCANTKGEEYRGRRSKTAEGFKCVRWAQSGDSMNEWQPHSFCRNNKGQRDRPWCYTQDGNWGYCGVPVCGCENYDPKNCGCAGVNKADYRGTINVTRSGKQCQSWSVQSPNRHSWYRPDHAFNRYDGLESNYCRNPLNDALEPWCYVAEPPYGWEYCNIPQCEPYSSTEGPAVVTTMVAEECIPRVILETFRTTNGMKIMVGNLDGHYTVKVRRAKVGREWETAKREASHWQYTDNSDYNAGRVQKYDITVENEHGVRMCGVKTVEVLRQDPIDKLLCHNVSIKHLANEEGVIDGFKTSLEKAYVVIHVDGKLIPGSVLEATKNAYRWSVVEKVNGEFRVPIETDGKQADKFYIDARIRYMDKTCAAVSQEIIMDSYKPEFKMKTDVRVYNVKKKGIDINTTRGDVDIKYEVDGVVGICESPKNIWAKANEWKGWKSYQFHLKQGFMVPYLDASYVDPPYLEKEITGLEGLNMLEFEVVLKSTGYMGDPAYEGKWANLIMTIDGVKYVLWHNFRLRETIRVNFFGDAFVTPLRFTPVLESGEPTPSVVQIPWRGKATAKLRFMFQGGGDLFWVRDISAKGNTALQNCPEQQSYKDLLTVDETGMLKFKKYPGKQTHFRVRVKASTPVGEVGYITLSIFAIY